MYMLSKEYASNLDIANAVSALIIVHRDSFTHPFTMLVLKDRINIYFVITLKGLNKDRKTD